MWTFWQCPSSGWDYDSHNREKRERVLRSRCVRLLRAMRRPNFPLVHRACDTRPVHRRMFRWMTPVCFPSFAGNYRGDSRFKCLRNYRVGVGGDPLVGAPPASVRTDIDALTKVVEQFVQNIEGPAGQRLSANDRILYVVEGVCYVLAEFLRIHPYANGNGHLGRFTVWALLLRFGYVPRSWPLEERPPDPPYSYCLSLYRSGQLTPLRHFMLKCITG